MSEEVWTNEGEACLKLVINGREEKVNKGTIANLKTFIGNKAIGAGVSKYKVYVDGEKLDSPAAADDIDVSEIKTIEIKTVDKVA